MHTRRSAILWGLGAVPAFCADFWKQKKIDQWSGKDVEKLLTRSPWAKDAMVEMTAPGMGGMGGPGGGGGRSKGGGGGAGGGMGEPGGGGGAMGGGGARGGGGQGGGMEGSGGGMGASTPQIHVTVRWESAMPVRTVLKGDALEAPAGAYVLAVVGIGAMGTRRPEGSEGARRTPSPEQIQAMMKQTTTLERKGKDPLTPARVENTKRGETSILLFVFEPGSQPIDLDDKEVVFATKLGPMALHAKFPLKDMMFDGKLAV